MFFKKKEMHRKKNHTIANININEINKNIIANIYFTKEKKKPLSKFHVKISHGIEKPLWWLNNKKNKKKIYKQINKMCYSIRLTHFWIKKFKIPVIFKINDTLKFENKGVNKAIQKIKNSFFLRNHWYKPYFINSLICTINSIYYKNPISLNKNVANNLKKSWRHRGFIFFTKYLISSVIWKTQYLKTSSNLKIKTVYMLINGKINSGTRTKQFKIKDDYKPSFNTFNNFITFKKEKANAKTGTFGIQTWFHY